MDSHFWTYSRHLSHSGLISAKLRQQTLKTDLIIYAAATPNGCHFKKSQTVANIFIKAHNEGLKREISSSIWQGVMFKTRWNDNHPETNCFSYLTSWKTCPVQLISEVQGLYCLLLPTKSYQLIRSVSNDQNTVCRMCKIGQESVKHVLSNCKSLARYDFILRHDSAFKCIVFPILTQYKIIEQCPTWCSPSKVTPYYENEIAQF